MAESSSKICNSGRSDILALSAKRPHPPSVSEEWANLRNLTDRCCLQDIFPQRGKAMRGHIHQSIQSKNLACVSEHQKSSFTSVSVGQGLAMAAPTSKKVLILVSDWSESWETMCACQVWLPGCSFVRFLHRETESSS